MTPTKITLIERGSGRWTVENESEVLCEIEGASAHRLKPKLLHVRAQGRMWHFVPKVAKQQSSFVVAAVYGTLEGSADASAFIYPGRMHRDGDHYTWLTSDLQTVVSLAGERVIEFTKVWEDSKLERGHRYEISSLALPKGRPHELLYALPILKDFAYKKDYW